MQSQTWAVNGLDRNGADTNGHIHGGNYKMEKKVTLRWVTGGFSEMTVDSLDHPLIYKNGDPNYFNESFRVVDQNGKINVFNMKHVMVVEIQDIK